MSTGFASLENVPIELEASERSRSSSQASGRQTQRSVLDTDHGSITDAGSSTRKDKENLERLLNIFNGGNGLNMGVSSSLIRAASSENRLFAYAKTKTQISFVVTTKLISVFVFAIWIVQYFCFLNLKFQASSHLL